MKPKNCSKICFHSNVFSLLEEIFHVSRLEEGAGDQHYNGDTGVDLDGVGNVVKGVDFFGFQVDQVFHSRQYKYIIYS